LGLFCQLNTCSTVIWHFKPRIAFKYGFCIAININEVGKMTATPEKNQIIKQPKLSLAQRFKKWLNGEYYKAPTKEEIQEAEELEQEAKEDEIEDSQGDGLMSEGDIMFPEEIE